MKEHTENLQRRLEAQGHHANGLMEVRVEDVRVAIDLMRAAQPLDETAERKYCHRVVFERGPQSLSYQTDELCRERAVIRAECAAEISDLRTRCAVAASLAREQVKTAAENIDLREQLDCASALLAEGGMNDAAWAECMTHRELQAQLSAAQAEIAAKKAYGTAKFLEANELYDKLFAAQAEIERLKQELARR